VPILRHEIVTLRDNRSPPFHSLDPARSSLPIPEHHELGLKPRLGIRLSHMRQRVIAIAIDDHRMPTASSIRTVREDMKKCDDLFRSQLDLCTL